jgi:hypothetical protein
MSDSDVTRAAHNAARRVRGDRAAGESQSERLLRSYA